MDGVLHSLGARTEDAEDLEQRVVASAVVRRIAGFDITASVSTVSTALATASEERRSAQSETGRRSFVTPSRLDALRAKEVLLKRIHQAVQDAQAGDGPMGVLDQGSDVRFGAKTPFEAAAAAAAAPGQPATARTKKMKKSKRIVSNAPAEQTDRVEQGQLSPAEAHVLNLRSLYSSSQPSAAGSAAPSDASKLLQHTASMNVSDAAWQRMAGSTNNVPDDHEVDALRRRMRAAELGATMVQLPGALRLHAAIHSKLLSYQVTGVRWLAELHLQRRGGIIADEMGLGKTVQVTCLLGALAASGWTKPSIVVCPATMLGHWYRELTMWCPQLRVLVLHDASEAVKRSKWSQQRILRCAFDTSEQPRVNVVITTYENVRRMGDSLTTRGWGYVLLDEGHRIRNPDAGITKAIKTFRTVHRIIVTGAPIQNRLTELWSLFDFVFPGRLGSRDTFESQFSKPIAEGSWASASALKAQTAFQCAVVLRDLIRPYLLRRVKKDVSAQLPPKTEKVIFTKLTPMQIDAYKSFVTSDAVQRVMEGGSRSFRALGMLQKLCNHPGLFAAKQLADEGADVSAQFLTGDDEASTPMGDARERFQLGRSSWKSSGKLQAAVAIVKAWVEGGHRVLWFTQGREMLDVLEGWVQHHASWKYMRMDGSTAVASRQGMVDVFNNDKSVNVFLLTTRVGGLGVNLTGADRVLLYDPAWNPSTDAQARERAWRLGQTKPVVVYRLVSSGTIEEKVYERQIFKQLLMAKVLGSGNSKQATNESNLKELFTLVEANGSLTTPAGVGRLERIALAARLGQAGGGEDAPGDALAVRVQAYDSDRESDDADGASTGSQTDSRAAAKQGEAGVLAALMDGASLQESFVGMHAAAGLSVSDKELIRATALRTAEAAAATARLDAAGADHESHPLPSAPQRPAPMQAPEQQICNKHKRSVVKGAVFGRCIMRSPRWNRSASSCDAEHSEAVVSGPGRVRNGFLLGIPPGTTRCTGWPTAVEFSAPQESVQIPASSWGGAVHEADALLHSSHLLRSLAARKLAPPVPPQVTSASPSDVHTSEGGPVATMAARLVAILAGHKHGLASKAVLHAYGQEAFAHKHVFREILRGVANFSSATKRWSLKAYGKRSQKRSRGGGGAKRSGLDYD